MYNIYYKIAVRLGLPANNVFVINIKKRKMKMLYSLLSGNFSFAQILMQLLASVFVVMLILPLHEMAHGFVAYKLGDRTAKNQGRLTLNPLAHLDYIGALSLILVGFGWATPVPVNPRNFKNPKRDMALVALAGPVSNLLAALAGSIILAACNIWLIRANITVYYYVAIFLNSYVSVNIGLAVFNLIPLPPLDGSKILGAFLKTETYVKMLTNERMLSMILLLCVFTGIIDKLVYFPRAALTALIQFLASLPFLPFI